MCNKMNIRRLKPCLYSFLFRISTHYSLNQTAKKQASKRVEFMRIFVNEFLKNGMVKNNKNCRLQVIFLYAKKKIKC